MYGVERNSVSLKVHAQLISYITALSTLEEAEG